MSILPRAILNLLEPPRSGQGPDGQLMALDRPERDAAELYCERRRRDKWFKTGLFWEPSWDILLYLFDAHESGRKWVSFGSLEAAPFCVSLESIERWLGLLGRYGYVVSDTAEDGTIKSVRLTLAGRSAMFGYLNEIDSARDPA